MSQSSPNPQINWPTAAVIVAFLAALVAVAIWGPGQTTTVVMVGMAILAAVGLNVVRSTEAKQEAASARENTNGNIGRLLEMVARQGEMLASMVPPPPPGLIEAQPERPRTK